MFRSSDANEASSHRINGDLAQFLTSINDLFHLYQKITVSTTSIFASVRKGWQLVDCRAAYLVPRMVVSLVSLFSIPQIA